MPFAARPPISSFVFANGEGISCHWSIAGLEPPELPSASTTTWLLMTTVAARAVVEAERAMQAIAAPRSPLRTVLLRGGSCGDGALSAASRLTAWEPLPRQVACSGRHLSILQACTENPL